MQNKPVLRILGIRGLPAAHGGFETFAEYLALHLVRHGWKVIVYCQEEGNGDAYVDTWEGVELVHIPVRGSGSKSTVIFDWLTILHASKHDDLCLTLGYNTAVFCALLRLKGVANIINMDGIEWSRAKWGLLAKAWFWINEWAGCWFGNHLVADHPEIKSHLSSRVSPGKITTIPYGAEKLAHGDHAVLAMYGLSARKYLTLIARPEPENSILDVVRGFSLQTRGMRLAVLGRYDEANAYHRSVKEAAGPEVVFLGPIYEKKVVQALRFHSFAYVHGHQVGGTNPSLVEALGAGNAVIAHDNRFNRWVAGEGAKYFCDAESFSKVLEGLSLQSSDVESMRKASIGRFEQGLTWESVLEQYRSLLAHWHSRAK